MKKLTIDFVRSEFEKEGYVLETTEYKGAHQKLKYICTKGHRYSMVWGHWQQGVRCPFCAGNGKLTIEFIKLEFEKEGYKLLSKNYKNSQTKLMYECDKGHIHSITWAHWQQGRRCVYCYYLNCRGENHPNYGRCGPLASGWKDGISCEPYCFEWSFKDFKDFIKGRDGNKCQNPDCWKTSNKLCVHHIDYNKKNCELGNLVTLCNSCNSRANFDREWHEAWYSAILQKRYNYQEITNAESNQT